MKKGKTVKNNVFYGVKWEGEAIEAVNNVARALLNLTEIFKSQNIKISMIEIKNKTNKKEKS